MELTESRNKYGKFEDDDDELVRLIDGRPAVRRPDNTIVASSCADDEVDASFLKRAGNPANHYGT